MRASAGPLRLFGIKLGVGWCLQGFFFLRDLGWVGRLPLHHAGHSLKKGRTAEISYFLLAIRGGDLWCSWV